MPVSEDQESRDNPFNDNGLENVSVVVLSWNSSKFLPGCLDALQRSQGVKLEVICVDNASTDDCHDIAENHPRCDVALRSEVNLGCGGGNNLGWRRTSHPTVVFINPDCRVEPDALRHLVRPLVNDDTVGVCGARLRYPNTQTIQHAGGILHPNAMCEHLGEGEGDDDKFHATMEVDYVTGALIAFRKADLEETGGFDDDFSPAYYEETDLIERLKKRNKRVLMVGEALAYHWESAGLTRMSKGFVRLSYRNRIRFLVKNRSLGALLTEALPFEVKWFFGPFAKGFRMATIRSYLSGAVFALSCLARFSKRPKGIH